MASPKALITSTRKLFHNELVCSLLTFNSNGVPSNADKDNKTSVRIATGIANRLQAKIGARAVAQTSGSHFEDCVAGFLINSFPKLFHLRPGKWVIQKVGNRNRHGIAKYAQYGHLNILKTAIEENPFIAASLGNDYTITPDIVVYRELLNNDEINIKEQIVDDLIATKADLRQMEGNLPILHASISTKWTLRSDRAQNARSEALNLIRNRKGRQPHIVVVTGEPTPSRLASLALGTGDIDCVYHFALNELIESVTDLDNSEAYDMLSIMVEGKRLKDISDLALDLAV